MFRIAICDDVNIICSQIEKTILKYSRKNCLHIDIEVFLSGEELHQYMLQEHGFDLIYLDIEMGEMNGIDVGKFIRNEMKDQKTEIVFISGKDNYDRQLFEIQPLHFIPKPLNSKEIIKDLKLAMLRADKMCGIFSYKKGADTFKIPIKDIIYFESSNREIRIVTIHKNDFFYGTIDSISMIVAKNQFLKIHRSYLINYLHAVLFRYDEVVMSNHTKLPISQSRRKEIRDIQMSIE